MTKKIAGPVWLALLLPILLCAAPKPAWAVFALEVQPARGGRDIRFQPAEAGRETINEEATVTVATDEGKQYRIVQQVLQPFTNERGEALRPDAVQVYSPDSVRGTLRITYPLPLRTGQEVIYTSDSAGTSDSFRLIFGLSLKPEDPSGRFQTQVRWEVAAVDGSVSPVSVIKNIFVDITTEFSIQVRNVEGGSGLDLGRITEKNLSGGGALKVEIQSNTGSRYRVSQQLLEPFRNERGETLAAEYVVYEAAQPSSGSVAAGGEPLSTAKSLLFTSSDSGQSTAFDVVFSTRNIERAPSGRYVSTLNYMVESDSAMLAQPKVVQARLTIDPILDLAVAFEGSSLQFGQFKSEGDSQVQRVEIKANNNTGMPYLVTQNVTRPFTNDTGDKIPETNFTARMQGEAEGEMAYPQEAPVVLGNQMIYRSGARGAPVVFEVYYKLTLPANAKSGQYSSEVTYSIAPL